MKLILYNNHSEDNNINKSLIKIVELTGFLREQASLINPLILIELDPKNIDGVIVDDNQVYVMYNNVKITWDSFSSKVLSANYCYIPDFNRYYFINDIISVRNNLWRIALSVDVSMSYGDKIKDIEALVTRNEYEYDPNIDDNLISYEYDKKVEYVTPDNLSNVTELNSAQILPNTVISYMTDDDVFYSGGVPSLDGLSQINMYTSGTNVKTQYLVGTGGLAFDIAREVYKNDTIKSFIKSIVMYPFPINFLFDNTKDKIKIGSNEIVLTDTFRWPMRTPDRIVIADFIIERKYNDYRDYSPFSKYEFYIPYCGETELSGESFLGDRIKIFYLVNYEDCTSTAYIYNVTKNKILFSSNATLGVKISLSSTNATEIKNQKTSLALNSALGVIGGAISIGAGMYTGNAYATATGVLSVTSAIGNAIVKSNELYDLGKIGVSSGVDGLSQHQKIHIKITRMEALNDEKIHKYYGKPLYKYRKLKDLQGVTILNNVRLENFGSATKQEVELIKRLLETGIIL